MLILIIALSLIIDLIIDSYLLPYLYTVSIISIKIAKIHTPTLALLTLSLFISLSIGLYFSAYICDM